MTAATVDLPEEEKIAEALRLPEVPVQPDLLLPVARIYGQPLDQLPQPLLAVVGLALLTLGLRAARMRCVALRPTPRREPERLSPRWRGRVIRPSPAQAPPQFS